MSQNQTSNNLNLYLNLLYRECCDMTLNYYMIVHEMYLYNCGDKNIFMRIS